MARPMPRPAPVTSAVRPFKSLIDIGTSIQFGRLLGHRKLEKDRDEEEQQRRTADNDLHGCLNSSFRLYTMAGDFGVYSVDHAQPGDPSRVRVGKGKARRHIKFRSMSDLERPFVRRYIQAAIDR